MPLRQPIVSVLGHVDHGKCVAPDTLIPLTNGSLVKAADLFDQYFNKGTVYNIDDGVVVEVKDGPEIFSFDGSKIVTKKISHLWKRNSPKQLIRVRIASGDEVITTPEHPFFVADYSQIGWKEASKLGKGDFILVPACLQFKSSEVSKIREFIAERLAKSDFLAFLDEYKSKEFIARLSKCDLKELKQKGFFSVKNPSDSIKHKRFRTTDLFKIGKLLGFSLDQIYLMILYIKNSDPRCRAGHTSKKILLPRELDDFIKLSYVLGCIQGDGSIYSNRVSLHNNDREIQENYMQILREAFGVNSKVKKGHTCQMIVDDGGLSLGRFLVEILGLPNKNKSSSISVPSICLLHELMYSSFIKGWFDTDGYVSNINNCIEITSKSKRIVIESSILLLNFGILSTVYEKNGFWYLRISNKPYVERFLEFIGSGVERKLSRIQKAVSKTSTSRIFDLIPLKGNSLKGKVVASNDEFPYLQRYFTYNKLSRSTLMKMLGYISDDEILSVMKMLTEDSIRFVKIVDYEVVDSEFEYVYDFSVPETKNFVANRMVLHNTSILDSIRSTTMASREAGAITQHIGASEVPVSVINERCSPLSKFMKINLTIPGLLFVDTPGHAAFTNLRKRGGSIADIAILVVDIAQGFQPQTIEALEILKEYKTPFIVAANKIDLITGWRTKEKSCFLESLPSQRQEVQNDLDSKIYELVGELSKFNIQSDRFDRVTDFTKTVAIVPVSAKTQEGIPELLMMISGLAQKFLESQLESKLGPGKCSIMEVKFEKGLGVTADVILYEGVIRKGDEIIFATKSGIKTTKIRGLLKPKPLMEMRDVKEASDRFTYVDEVYAASGIKIFAPDLEDALPGSSIYVVGKDSDLEKIKSELEEELKEILIKTENVGMIVRADTLGSLEAIIKLLESDKTIEAKIRKADVGPVTKADILEAYSVRQQDRYSGVILAFNVSVDSELETECQQKGIGIIKSNIIYSLLDQLKLWKEEERKREQQEAVAQYTFPAKIRFMQGYAFRSNKPAIFGVEVLIGRIKQGDTLIKEDGTEIGTIKSIQVEKQSKTELKEKEQAAISMDEPTIGRHIFEGEVYYTKVPLKDALTLRDKYKSLLTGQELDLLDLIMRLTRK